MSHVRRIRVRGNLSIFAALVIVLAIAGAVVLLLYVVPLRGDGASGSAPPAEAATLRTHTPSTSRDTAAPDDRPITRVRPAPVRPTPDAAAEARRLAAPPSAPPPRGMRSHVQVERVARATADLAALADALQLYSRAAGRFPASLDDLLSPVRGYVDGVLSATALSDGGVPVDPWGQDYIYEPAGDTASLKTRGADLTNGGSGYDADLIVVLSR